MNNETEYYILLLDFVLFGGFLALCYEILRILRLCVRHNSFVTGVEDTLYLTMCGVFLFAFSMEIGNGQFRIYFGLGAVVGAVVYFLTIGRIFRIVYSFVIKILKKIFRWIYTVLGKPIIKLFVVIKHKIDTKFVHLYDFSNDVTNKYKKRLQTRRKIVYNDKVLDYVGEGDVQSASKSAIKGKVQKKK